MSTVDEYRDIFDANRNPTGRVHKRGVPLPKGDYILATSCWVINSAGKFLITRRALGVSWRPGMWGTPGGGALPGEDSLTAAIREAKEETGIILNPHGAEMLVTSTIDHAHIDHWLFRQEFDLSALVLQAEETMGARAAAWAEIALMIEQGEFIKADCPALYDFLRSA